MQYLLTEEEFHKLVTEQRARMQASDAQLQAFCTLAAMHIPVAREYSHDKTPRPWGCILGSKEQNPGYCDDCPATEVCPYGRKEWLQ